MLVERCAELALGVHQTRTEMRIEQRLLESAGRQLLALRARLYAQNPRRVAESGNLLERREGRVNHRRPNFFDNSRDADSRHVLAKLDCHFAAGLQPAPRFMDLAFNDDITHSSSGRPQALPPRKHEHMRSNRI